MRTILSKWRPTLRARTTYDVVHTRIAHHLSVLHTQPVLHTQLVLDTQPRIHEHRTTRDTLPPAFDTHPMPYTKPLILFDLNGTLVNTTEDRKDTGVTFVRPGIGALKRLKPMFRIGVYSAASETTVRELVRRLDIETGESLFTVIMDAKWCDSYLTRMVKPLRKHFGAHCLSHVLLVDNTPFNSAPGESANIICLPTWNNNSDDDVIPRFVDAMLDSSKSVADARVWAASTIRILRYQDVLQSIRTSTSTIL